MPVTFANENNSKYFCFVLKLFTLYYFLLDHHSVPYGILGG